MRVWWSLVVVAACGRIGFDPNGAPGDVLSVVQTGALLATPSDLPAIAIATTAAGDLLVVATSNIDGDAPLVSIGDDAGNTYVAADAQYASSCCTGEVWYAADIAADTQQITIVDSAPIRREIWMLEVSGAEALVASNDADLVASDTGAPGPAVVPSRVPAIVITMMNSGVVTADDPEFNSLPSLNADEAGWRIVSAPGSYAPIWTVVAGAEYGAATVAFAP